MLELYAGNRAAMPGALEVLGERIDLGRVECDSFVVAGMNDHITPWQPGYMTSWLLGGDTDVVVTTTGHIQTMVNPPGKPRARYFSGPADGPDPEAWRAKAEEHEGSWWPGYADWLLARSGPERDAPAEPGSSRHRPLGPAPGTYVLEQ
jgi:polyhydroxyalkanoate synthase